MESELTKEVLAQEGWVFRSGFNWDWPNAVSSNPETRPYLWSLNFVGAEKPLIIKFYDNNYLEWCTGYEGPCENLETLKYLMNLLRINQPELQEPTGKWQLP